MENLIFLSNIVLPIFFLILIGLLIKRKKLITDDFVRQLSKFVFNISLPALIFLKLVTVKINEAFDEKLILISLFIIMIIFTISWILGRMFTKTPEDMGAFVQGSYRSNFAIVGLAMLSGIVDSLHLGKAVMVLAFIMPAFNILAVIALTVPLKKADNIKISGIIKDILKNPLIMSAYIAIPFSYLKIDLYPSVSITLDYLSKIALPLALIGIGASINLKELLTASPLSFFASFNKIILFPIIAIIVGILFDIKYQDLLILFILIGTPTAVASFVMADAMGSNSKMAGNIITISTFGSIFTITIGVYLLKYLGFV